MFVQTALLNYMVSWAVTYMVLGMLAHIADRQWGVPFYSWVYSSLLRRPLPEGMEFGLLYNRSYARQKWIAFLISVSQSWWMYKSHDVNPGFEVFMMFFEAYVFIFAFRLGNPVWMLYKKQEELYDYKDKLGVQLRHFSVRKFASETWKPLAATAGHELEHVRSGITRLRNWVWGVRPTVPKPLEPKE
jgi:hypothetical protein